MSYLYSIFNIPVSWFYKCTNTNTLKKVYHQLTLHGIINYYSSICKIKDNKTNERNCQQCVLDSKGHTVT